MERKFKILPHTADLRIEVYGKTIKELFINAAEAIAEIQNKSITLASRSRVKCYGEKIKVKSIDLNSLLVDFLSEILAKSHINKAAYFVSNIKINVLRFTLHASCVGCPVERFDEDIKAATYEDLDIKQISGIWQTKLVFDV